MDHFQDWLAPKLDSLGYSGAFLKKPMNADGERSLIMIVFNAGSNVGIAIGSFEKVCCCLYTRSKSFFFCEISFYSKPPPFFYDRVCDIF